MDAVDVADNVLEHRPDVCRADEDRLGLCECLPPPRRQSRVAAHRVLELRAVCLDREACAARGPDRAPEQDVVREDEVDGLMLPQCRRVPLHPGVELGPSAALDELDLVALVAVEHEDRQQPTDIRPDRGGAAEIVELRLGLLAEHGDLVTRPCPLSRQRPGVHIRARAAEEVAVPEQDLHGRRPQNEGSRIAASCRYRPHAARTRSLLTSSSHSPGLRRLSAESRDRLGGFGEIAAEPPDRAARPDATSSVAR